MSEPTPVPIQKRGLRAELGEAINRCSAENGSNTPDFILAEYLVACLKAFDAATTAREKWYGHSHSVGGGIPIPAVSEIEEAPRDADGHAWLSHTLGPGVTTAKTCLRCGAHEDGKPCRPFAPGDLEGMCMHDAYRNEACEECGRDAEPSQTTTEETP